ncbi:MAG: VCBS repeat-containing protein [Candidatus Kerfeldbacteria bacterium]|nr:VCBS repeat-containing protein [Candidatus Kerfeldbacteria bacterium]
MHHFLLRACNRWALLLLLFGGCVGIPSSVSAQSLDQLPYPRTANIFLLAPITESQARELAQWDIVVLSIHVQDVSPKVFAVMREENPNIKILAYVPSNEFPWERLDTLESKNGPYHQIVKGIDSSWWLRNTDQTIMSLYLGNRSLNVTDLLKKTKGKRWNTYLPERVHTIAMSTGFWDGIFYDSVWDAITPFFPDEQLDLDMDGVAESAATQNAAWKDGMETLMAESRRLEGPEKLIIGNGGANNYLDSMNGRLIENFPDLFGEGWTRAMKWYGQANVDAREPIVNIVNGDTNNSGKFKEFRRMRLGLTSTLLFDGFYSFDSGTLDHSQLWWYDEYSVDLGYPISRAKNLFKPNDPTMERGIWMREFEHGAVVVNSTTKQQTFRLPFRMQKIKGTQDTKTNDGKEIEKLTLKPEDGIVLLRIAELVAAPQRFSGEVITVDVYGGTHLRSFTPYGPSFQNGVHIYVDDLNRDGNNEIVTMPARGSSHVRIFSTDGRAITAGFFAFAAKSEHNGDVVAMDMDRDGKKELVVSSGTGQLPWVRVFSQDGVFVRQFLAYGRNYRGGVSVAAQDFDGDGIEEIVTGSKTASSHVRVFSSTGRPLSAGFFAYPNFSGGVNITAADMNGDDQYEILTAPNSKSDHVLSFSEKGRRLSPGFFSYNATEQGVNVVAEDLDGNRTLELFTGTERGSTWIRRFTFEGRLLSPGFYLFAKTFLGGVMVQLNH